MWVLLLLHFFFVYFGGTDGDNNGVPSRLPPILFVSFDFFQTLYLRSPCENRYKFYSFLFAHCLKVGLDSVQHLIRGWIKLHPHPLITEFEVHLLCVYVGHSTSSFHSFNSSRRFFFHLPWIWDIPPTPNFFLLQPAFFARKNAAFFTCHTLVQSSFSSGAASYWSREQIFRTHVQWNQSIESKTCGRWSLEEKS
jgi:hypothetical protein